jgi:hypothetical protein
LDNLDYIGIGEVHARSRSLDMGGVSVKVPAPEDHLRILCLHLLRHGAWRPLWLCDIAAALESRDACFDWDTCLGTDRRSDWIACAVGLANNLLGANAAGTPAERRAERLPRWLLPTVLRQWGSHYKFRGPLQAYLRHPAGLLKELRHHWPNSIEATVNMKGPFNGLPRFPFQVGDTLARAAGFVRRMPRLLRDQ